MVYAGCLILRGWDYRWTNWSNMINLVNLGMLSERYQTTHLSGQWMVMNVMDMRTGTVQTFLVVRKPQRLLWRVQAFSSMDFCFSLSRWWLVHLTGSTRGFRRCPKRPSIDASREIGRRLYILILESFPTLSNHPSLGYEKNWIKSPTSGNQCESLQGSFPPTACLYTVYMPVLIDCHVYMPSLFEAAACSAGILQAWISPEHVTGDLLVVVFADFLLAELLRKVQRAMACDSLNWR